MASSLPTTITSQTTLTPPGSPSNTAKYIVPASGATGAWASYPNKITWYENGAWAFATPPAGWEVFVTDVKTDIVWDGTGWDSPIAGIAPSVSPNFTGTPTVPTAAVNTNTTQIASTAFVMNQGYAPLASPALTGTPTVPTATAGTNTTQAASTAFVAASFAPIANPTFTGTATAPTFSGAFVGSGAGLTLGTISESFTIQNLGTVSAQIALTASAGRYVKMTLAANINLILNDGASTTATEKVIIEITQDATGSRTIYWEAHKGFFSGMTPVLSTAPGAVDILEFIWNGSYWMLVNLASNIATSSSIVYGLRPSTWVNGGGFTTTTNPTSAYDSGTSPVVDTSTFAYFASGSNSGGTAVATYKGFSGVVKSGTLYVKCNLVNGTSFEPQTISYSTNNGSTWNVLETLNGGQSYNSTLSVALTNQDPTQLQVKLGQTSYNMDSQTSAIYDIVFI